MIWIAVCNLESQCSDRECDPDLFAVEMGADIWFVGVQEEATATECGPTRITLTVESDSISTSTKI
jgi:hypothetical protein